MDEYRFQDTDEDMDKLLLELAEFTYRVADQGLCIIIVGKTSAGNIGVNVVNPCCRRHSAAEMAEAQLMLLSNKDDLPTQKDAPIHDCSAPKPH